MWKKKVKTSLYDRSIVVQKNDGLEPRSPGATDLSYGPKCQEILWGECEIEDSFLVRKKNSIKEEMIKFTVVVP